MADPHTLTTTKDADGMIHFRVMMHEPGCFVGHITPEGHVVAYLHADLDPDNEDSFVTCLDSEEIE